MGHGSWSDDTFLSREKIRAATGKSAFTYTDEEMAKVRPEERKVHQKLDPKGVTRESRDSTTHPESLSIAVVFDHTGSMKEIPRIFQRQLGRLMGLLLENGIKDPQVLLGAFGDATSDQAPLQIGQYESDINMEDDLGRLLLEGNGGPYGQESYELPIYFVARHTAIDCWEKRKKKGYLFLSGDEMPYDVKVGEVKRLIGDDLAQNIPVANIIAEAKEKYHVFFIIPTHANGGRNPNVARRWVELLGQDHVIQLDNPETISEKIASIVKENEVKTLSAKAKTPDVAPKETTKKKPGRVWDR